MYSNNGNTYVTNTRNEDILRLAIEQKDIASGKLRHYTKVHGDLIAHITPAQHTLREVLIPITEFTRDYEKMTQTEAEEYLKAHIGMAVRYYLTKLSKNDNGDLIAYGTRTRALTLLRKNFWFEKDTKGSYYADKGTVLSAQVINVRANSIMVEAAGVEAIIRREYLPETTRDNIERNYAIGDVITVETVSVTRDESNTQLKLTVQLSVVANNAD